MTDIQILRQGQAVQVVVAVLFTQHQNLEVLAYLVKEMPVVLIFMITMVRAAAARVLLVSIAPLLYAAMAVRA
jgi:hypothetical protein